MATYRGNKKRMINKYVYTCRLNEFFIKFSRNLTTFNQKVLFEKKKKYTKPYIIGDFHLKTIKVFTLSNLIKQIEKSHLQELKKPWTA